MSATTAEATIVAPFPVEALQHGRGAPLFAWGRGDELTLCIGTPTRKQARSQSAHGSSSSTTLSPAESMAVTVQWNARLPETYALVCEASARFEEVRVQANGPPMLRRAHLLEASRHYRALLRAHAHSLQQAVHTGRDQNGDSISSYRVPTYEEEAQRSSLGELVWELAEVLYVTQSTYVTGQLINWLQAHFSNDVAVREVCQTKPPENHPKYWTLLEQFVLQGRIEDARHLLAAHSDSTEQQAFALFDLVLRSMPRLTASSSPTGFYTTWQQWHKDANGLLSTNEELRKYPQLHSLLNLVAGDEDALANASVSWYTLLVSHLLFVNPTAKANELQFLADRCRSAMGESEEITDTLDQLLVTAFSGNVTTLLRLLIQRLGSWWIVAHLGDLLHHCGSVESYRLESGFTLREYFLLEYGTSLIGEDGLWQVAAKYFAACPPFGSHYIAQLLETEEPDTETKALQLLSVCDQYQLTNQMNTVQRVMGAKKFAQLRPVSSVYWLMLAQDVTRLSQVADRLIDQCVTEESTVEDLDGVAEHLGDQKFVFSEKLSFLNKYCELQQYRKNKDYSRVAELTLQLFSSKLAPKRLWVHLLLDTLPLLERSEPVFNAEQTFQLMECLETVLLSHRHEEFMANAALDKKTGSTQLSKLSMALTANLAKAFLLCNE